MMTVNGKAVSDSEGYNILSANPRRRLGWNPDTDCPVLYTAWTGPAVHRATRQEAGLRLTGRAITRAEALRRLREIGACRDPWKSDRLCGALLADLAE